VDNGGVHDDLLLQLGYYRHTVDSYYLTFDGSPGAGRRSICSFECGLAARIEGSSEFGSDVRGGQAWPRIRTRRKVVVRRGVKPMAS
jgi:hypothetical protein